MASHREVLRRIAVEAATARQFVTTFPSSVRDQLARIGGPAAPADGARDLTDLPWASIDNDDSRDLDQLTTAATQDDGAVRIWVAIADVDGLVGRDSPIDRRAEVNTVTLYPPGETFPMLPERLSTDLTSLNEGERRAAVVVQLDVAADGEVTGAEIYPAVVHNRAQLAYDAVSTWLDDKGGAPAGVAADRELAACLELQDVVAERLRARRLARGAVELESTQARAVFNGDELVALQVEDKNRARRLIEEFMVAANSATARFLTDQGVPSMRRVVREPRRWDRLVEIASQHGFDLPSTPDVKALQAFLEARRAADPVRFPDLSLTTIKLLGSGEYVVDVDARPAPGHFALAAPVYAHTTAPNRRYPDLITQRLLKAVFQGARTPYDLEDLESLAAHCTVREDEAERLQRQVMKSAAALLLAGQIGARFEAIVTGSSATGTWVRLLTEPVEGKLIQSAGDVDVGDRLTVKLVAVDVGRGFIDFTSV
jgi:exoribonuclease-2